MLSMRALVTQARTNLAGHARLHKVVFDRGFLDGVDLWWLPAAWASSLWCRPKTTWRRRWTPRPKPPRRKGSPSAAGRIRCAMGQGKTAWTERLETEVVGITGLTTYDQYGTPEHGRHHNRRDFQPNPINAVVVRKWHGRDVWPGGQNRLPDQCRGGASPCSPLMIMMTAVSSRIAVSRRASSSGV